MCSNYISCEGISLNQAHIVRNDDLRVEPSSSLVVSQSILTQHHLNLIKDLEGELSLNFWSKIFAKRNQENLKMGSSTCLSLIARHFPLSMTWCRCFTTFKWKRDGIPTSCPVTSIGKTGPRNSIKDLLVGSRILTTPSHLCQEEYHKYYSQKTLLHLKTKQYPQTNKDHFQRQSVPVSLLLYALKKKPSVPGAPTFFEHREESLRWQQFVDCHYLRQCWLVQLSSHLPIVVVPYYRDPSRHLK